MCGAGVRPGAPVSACGRRLRPRRPGALCLWASLSVTLPVDELRQPADLAVHRLEPVALQLERVAVDALAGPRQRGPQTLPLPLDRAPAALEDPQPHVRGGVPEEGQVDAEVTSVVVRLRAGLADQFLEALLALRGDRVDHLPAAAGERRRVRRQQLPWAGLDDGDEPGRVEPLQRGIQRAVGDAAQAPEHRRELLAQLVPVHRRLLQQAQDGELEHSAPQALCRSMYRDDTSTDGPRGNSWSPGSGVSCGTGRAPGVPRTPPPGGVRCVPWPGARTTLRRGLLAAAASRPRGRAHRAHEPVRGLRRQSVPHPGGALPRGPHRGARARSAADTG